MLSRRLSLILLIALLTGCSAVPTQALPTLVPTLALPTQPPVTETPVATETVTVTPMPTDTATPEPSPTPEPVVLIGAGDIAYCGNTPETLGDDQTAAIILDLIKQYPNAQVITMGDNAYGEGTRAEFKNCFGASWGQFKDRVHPSPGNHEYMTDSAQPYFDYFGEAAGQPGVGYYSFDLADWHIVAINSVCNDIGCGKDSKQVAWFQEDLAASQQQCKLAYWHHPRWSSGIAGTNGVIASLWKTAVGGGVDVVMNGHDHDYERFAPQDGEGNADPNGARQFVVGTGGGTLRDFGEVRPNSEVRIDHQFGIMLLKLYPGRYEWQFIPVDPASAADSGAGECH